ncbi:hypothetical protein LPJ81_005798, partial [Coemansia sp. IMI 209127]
MDTVDLTTAEYLDAFSTIDQSIRNLIDGGADPKKQQLQISVHHTEDDDATVAFLCSGLPHYEGMTGVDYSDLRTPLPLDSTHDDADCSDFEESVPDSAWCSSEHLDMDMDMTPLASPQTLAAGTGGEEEEEEEEERKLAAYEGWIDFDALTEAAQDALAPFLTAQEAACLSIGRRTETDYMLVYALATTENQNNSNDDIRWMVQVPKPALPIHVFESEI